MLKKMLLTAAVTVSLVSCQKTDPEQSLPVIHASGKVAFNARYVIPLTTDAIGNGEEEIVDPIHAKATNTTELNPTFTQIMQDAMNGMLNTYPEEGMEDAENNPSTYLGRILQKIDKPNSPGNLASLTQRFEIDYKGTGLSDHSAFQPLGIDIIWVDLGEVFPDKIVGRLKMEELTGYTVQTAQGAVSLNDYLTQGAFEQYVIRVESPADTFGVRSFQESQALMAQIDAGQISNLRRIEAPRSN